MAYIGYTTTATLPRTRYLGVLPTNGAPDFTSDGSTVISANSSAAALRITQVGAGNALLVEDSANPDSTPFVVDTNGTLLKGITSIDTTTPNSSNGFNGLMISSTASSASTITQLTWNTGFSVAPYIQLGKSNSSTIGVRGQVTSGQLLGRISAIGDDGTNFINAAFVDFNVDGTPGTNDMPGRIVLYTTADGASTPTERMRIDNAGAVGIGATPAAGQSFRVSKSVTGNAIGTSILSSGTIQSDVVTRASYFSTFSSTAATSFNLAQLNHVYAEQSTFGSGSTVTTQIGFNATSTLVGATNNYGFYSNIAAGTTRTITNVERTSNVVTITTSVAHGYTAGQSVTVAATTNTGVNGTFTIASVPTSTTFTYAQVGTDIPSGADTGTTVVVGRYNFYANGTAPNYFAGNVGIGTTNPTTLLNVVANTSTDAVRITQTGAGNALVVEDSANPDSTPFVVTTDGNVLLGATSGTGNERLYVASDTSLGYLGSSAGSSGSPIRLRRSNGTVSSPTSVSAENTLGIFQIYGYDGTNYIEAARITSSVDATPGTNDMPGRLVFSTTADGASTPTERMRIDSSGNVGIGTSSPVNKLQVNGSFGRGAPVTKTGDFTLAATENWIICNGTGSITVTLPAASSWTGRELTIKTIAAQTVVSASSNVVPLAGGSAGTAILPATAGSWATLVSDGTNWIIMQS